MTKSLYEEGNGSYYFDEVEALRFESFFPKFLTHVKGELGGQPLELMEWVRDDIIRPLFGVKRVEDDLRRFRVVYVEVPRKNAKTTVAAGVALAVMFLDNEPGAEVYSCAGDRDQAAICFDIARQMVSNSPHLDRRAKVYRRAITVPSLMASYKVISADAHTKHGFNAHCVIFDELHTQPNRDLWDVMMTSVGARRQPIVFAITTAGFDKNSICYEMHSYAQRVKSGEVKDDTFLPVIYGASTEDDWKDPEVWARVNPGLGISLRLEHLEQECSKAQELPSYENTFKRLHLDIWTEQETRWLPMDTWNKCVGHVVPEELKEMPCYAGLDLSSTQDLSALVLIFEVEGKVKILPYFWIPEEGVHKRVRKDKVPYDVWLREGLLEESPGEVIDYQRIRAKINSLNEIYNIQEIACDRWNAQALMTQLDEEDGFTVVPLTQQMSSLSGPTKELEKLVVSRNLEHGNNPIMNWCAANVTIKMDANGNIRPDKEKSMEKIDGIVALICGLSRWMVHTDASSVYTERGLLTL